MKYLKERTFTAVRKEKHDPTKLVKGRNEPCKILEVLEVVSKIKNIEPAELAEISYKNTCKLFGLEE